MPLAASYRPDPRHLDLGEGFSDVVAPARFPRHVLRFRNQRAAATVGLDTLTEGEWEAAFARFEPLPRNLPEPRALRYHGHQFRHYNPDLGDGRGFLFAQLRDDHDRLLDLGTKGSGRTPWSRGGDGRLTLQGAVREVLAAELLEALGVPTSRAFSLYETGEGLVRHDEPSPTRAGVLVRLSWSHIRVGTFQRLAFLGDTAGLRQLTDHVLTTLYPAIDPDPGAPASPATLLAAVTDRCATLAAAWMNAGFVHGVLNTDNLSITGESFDYGPWRFLDRFDPHHVAAYFDDAGLYAYGRQPEAVLWNLHRLAESLAPIGDVDALQQAVDGFVPAFQERWRRGLLGRLGLAPAGDEEDARRVSDVVAYLSRAAVGFERFLFDWYGGSASRDRALTGPAAAAYRDPAFASVGAWLPGAAPEHPERLAHPYFSGDGPSTLIDPEYRALWRAIAERDDWGPFEAKIAAIRVMGEALAGAAP